jgi:hypothetical protein
MFSFHIALELQREHVEIPAKYRIAHTIFFLGDTALLKAQFVFREREGQ